MTRFLGVYFVLREDRGAVKSGDLGAGPRESNTVMWSLVLV
jgi:hypothetical protein